MPRLLFCSQALQQIKSYSGLFSSPTQEAQKGDQNLPVQTDICCAVGGERSLPDKAEDKYPSDSLSLDWNDTSLYLSLVHDDSYNHSSLSLTCP